jgi:hypothetical protein
MIRNPDSGEIIDTSNRHDRVRCTLFELANSIAV